MKKNSVKLPSPVKLQFAQGAVARLEWREFHKTFVVDVAEAGDELIWLQRSKGQGRGHGQGRHKRPDMPNFGTRYLLNDLTEYDKIAHAYTVPTLDEAVTFSRSWV